MKLLYILGGLAALIAASKAHAAGSFPVNPINTATNNLQPLGISGNNNGSVGGLGTTNIADRGGINSGGGGTHAPGAAGFGLAVGGGTGGVSLQNGALLTDTGLLPGGDFAQVMRK